MSYSILGATILGCAALVSTALAEPVTWQPTETVATGVTDLAPAAGRAVAYVEDGWLIAYVADGEVVVRERDDATGWDAGVPLTSGAGNVSAPQLGYAVGIVHLIWEDDRNGHPEIYTRRLEEGVWTAEECLSCDGVRSAAASLAARNEDQAGSPDDAFVAWEEGPEGSTTIQGRRYDDGVWESALTISDSPAVASGPSLSALNGTVVATWTDSRNGHLDIYRRSDAFSGFTSGENLTEHEGQDATHSSVRCEYEWTDFALRYDLVTYRKESDPPRLSYVIATDSEIMPGFLDLAAFAPNLSGQAASFTRSTSDFCAFWGGIISEGEWFATVGAGIDGTRRFDVTTFDGFAEAALSTSVTLSTTGIGDLHLGTIEGVPDARLLAVWIEDDGGTPTLRARPGTEIGGSASGVVERSASLLISPGGALASTVEVEDIYTGESVDCQACLYFTSSVAVFDGGVTDYCENPPSPFVFHVRGGGCDPTGRATITAPVDDTGAQWVGIRSPDVDGNCVVDAGDVAYVESFVGTDDFCADLDGSGIVDQGDVDIATMTLGDACASVDVPGSPPAVVAPALALAPNPARSTAFIRLSVPQATTAAVTIYDATGRRVRDIALNVAAGSTLVPWDLHDQQGRPAGVGTYFVRAEAGGSVLHATLTVVE
jgi:hypothetical protein